MKGLTCVTAAAGALGQYSGGCGVPPSFVGGSINGSLNSTSRTVMLRVGGPVALSIRSTPLRVNLPFSRRLVIGRPSRMALSAHAEMRGGGSDNSGYYRGHNSRKKSRKINKPNSDAKKLTQKYPFDGYAKPLDRRWDAFWGEAVTLRPGQARRHIVMVSVLKQSIIAMRGYADKQGVNTDLKELYRELVNEYYGISLKKDRSLSYLEAALFFALHNTKFNIFIGSRVGNSVINDIGYDASRTEDHLISEILESLTIAEITGKIEHLHGSYIDVRSNYKDLEYAQMRAEAEKTILTILMPTTDPLVPLPLVKQDLIERVMSISDSLATDISGAQHADLRRWQNSVFIPLQKEFLELKGRPNFDRYAKALSHFLRSESEGADILNLDLSKLREFRRNPDAVKLFVQAISEDAR